MFNNNIKYYFWRVIKSKELLEIQKYNRRKANAGISETTKNLTSLNEISRMRDSNVRILLLMCDKRMQMVCWRGSGGGLTGDINCSGLGSFDEERT